MEIFQLISYFMRQSESRRQPASNDGFPRENWGQAREGWELGAEGAWDGNWG